MPVYVRAPFELSESRGQESVPLPLSRRWLSTVEIEGIHSGVSYPRNHTAANGKDPVLKRWPLPAKSPPEVAVMDPAGTTSCPRILYEFACCCTIYVQQHSLLVKVSHIG